MAKRTKKRNIRVSKKRVSRKKYTKKNKRKYTKKYGNTRRKIRKNKMRGGGKRYQAVAEGLDPYKFTEHVNKQIDDAISRIIRGDTKTIDIGGRRTITITNNFGTMVIKQIHLDTGNTRDVVEIVGQASGPVGDRPGLDQLTAMGFAAVDANAALDARGGDVYQASEWLLQGNTAPAPGGFGSAYAPAAGGYPTGGAAGGYPAAAEALDGKVEAWVDSLRPPGDTTDWSLIKDSMRQKNYLNMTAIRAAVRDKGVDRTLDDVGAKGGFRHKLKKGLNALQSQTAVAQPQGGYAPPQGGYAPPQGGYAPGSPAEAQQQALVDMMAKQNLVNQAQQAQQVVAAGVYAPPPSPAPASPAPAALTVPAGMCPYCPIKGQPTRAVYRGGFYCGKTCLREAAAAGWVDGVAPGAAGGAPAPAGSPAAQFRAQQGQFGAPAPAAAASARPEWGPGTTVKLIGNLTLKNQRNGDAVIPGGSTLTVYYQAETTFGRGRHFRAIFGEKDGWVSNYDLTQAGAAVGAAGGAPGPAGGAAAAGGASGTNILFYRKPADGGKLYEFTNFFYRDPSRPLFSGNHSGPDTTTVWKTPEHYFQVYKFLHSHGADIPTLYGQSRDLPTGNNGLNAMGPQWGTEMEKRHPVNINYWHGKGRDGKMTSGKDRAMYNAVKMKFTQNPDLQKLLVDTGVALIIENAGPPSAVSPGDKYWGDGGWGNTAAGTSSWDFTKINSFAGKNKLGLLLMEIRDELTRGNTLTPYPHALIQKDKSYDHSIGYFNLQIG